MDYSFENFPICILVMVQQIVVAQHFLPYIAALEKVASLSGSWWCWSSNNSPVDKVWRSSTTCAGQSIYKCSCNYTSYGLLQYDDIACHAWRAPVSYHLQRLQNLKLEDYPHRFSFCKSFLGCILVEPHFGRITLVSDEACFTRDAHFNSRKLSCRGL